MAKLSKNISISLLLLILVCLGCTKLAQKYVWDVTQNNSNSLSNASMSLLDSLDAKITVTVYSPDMEILNMCDSILAPYKNYTQNIVVELKQTILEPKIAAKLKLLTEYNLLINYKDAQQGMDLRLQQMNEQHISALMQQTINQANHWLVFLTGHEEADPVDTNEYGLSSFAEIFTKQGMHITTLNLAQAQVIPQNTELLIVANPQQELLPIEEELLHDYIANGGKLIWFTEPDAPVTTMLVDEFGLKPAKGVAIDPESSRMGSPHPALKIITRYPEHAINSEISSATIMPWSGHLQILYQANDWEQIVFLESSAATWTYSGPATKDFDVLNSFREHNGPLNLGIALSRIRADKSEQRALVIADSSFIINKYLHLYANRQLAANLVSWVQNDKNTLVFNTPPRNDLSYYPSKVDSFMYKYVFTIILPLFLVTVGFLLNSSWPNWRFRLKLYKW